jgi:anti-sigma regulatory factor (Ser/Thr protein kinase)
MSDAAEAAIGLERPALAPGAQSMTGQAQTGVRRAACQWPNVSSLELAALPTAATCGRLHAKAVLWEWGLGELVDTGDVELLVSELLSNAVKASCSPGGVGVIGLRLLCNARQVVIEVWDHSPDYPQPKVLSDESESGRGLAVIEALSHRWGWRRVGAYLKVVWCEVRVNG